MNTKYKLAAGLSLGVAIVGSIAFAQVPKPLPSVPPPTLKIVPPQVLSAVAGVKCGERANVAVRIFGGTHGSNGKVTVLQNGKVAGTGTYIAPANAEGAATFKAPLSDCFHPTYVSVKVESPNLNVTKILEPAGIQFRESAGPI